MGILFFVALLLAWPTFGLSLVAWFVLLMIKGKSNANKIVQREKVKEAIEPLFEGQFAKFFAALDIPIYDWEEISDEDAHQCGRHIMNYIAHNPSETSLFVSGLRKQATKGGPALCDPVTAAEDENRQEKGAIHLVSYRAVESVMANNKLRCFSKLDLAGVLEKKVMLEFQYATPNRRT